MSEKIKIEKGVPIPERTKRSKYPTDKLNVGESFWAPGKPAAVRSGIRYSTPEGVLVITRVEGNGLRVWRIK